MSGISIVEVEQVNAGWDTAHMQIEKRGNDEKYKDMIDFYACDCLHTSLIFHQF